MNGCYKTPVTYPPTPRTPVTDVVHGVTITDEYRWLEDAAAPNVTNWVAQQEALTRRVLDALPQQAWLTQRLERLWRYDDETVPMPVLDGPRVFFSRKHAADEKWLFMTAAHTGAVPDILLNPNTWDVHETLDNTAPSPDGAYLVYGVARAGDEDAQLHVLRLADRALLPDTFQGWRQGGVAWLRDNSGFFYSAKPRKGTVPAGAEHYWHSAWFHKLGTPAEQDQKVFWDDTAKEYWHGVSVSEDGRWLVFLRGLFNRADVYVKPVGSTNAPVPVVTNIDARFSVTIVNDRMYIKTNWQAPRERVMVADLAQAGIEHWRTFIPECDDTLEDVQFIAGKVFAVYLHDAYSVIRIHRIDGTFERELPLPGIGAAGVGGYWSKPMVWVSFTSYTHVPSTYAYVEPLSAAIAGKAGASPVEPLSAALAGKTGATLVLLHRTPIALDMAPYTSTQVWYHSKDGTAVPLFLIGKRDARADGTHAVLLTGYGGFNVSMQPHFSSMYGLWLEAGGMVAIPCLRGGGEFGEDWHRAGMRQNKQNVFDDFIAAAEWLVREGWTTPRRLVISGGSNGGLLVGAAVVQRPDLFAGVMCSVPLLDMLRYHLFGLANIWSEEYGTAAQADQFAWLQRYSPYQRVTDGVRYPPILLIAGENDARVDALHARKMAARLQAATHGGGPILLLQQKASGHGGAVTLRERIVQTSAEWAFLLDCAGL